MEIKLFRNASRAKSPMLKAVWCVYMLSPPI